MSRLWDRIQFEWFLWAHYRRVHSPLKCTTCRDFYRLNSIPYIGG